MSKYPSLYLMGDVESLEVSSEVRELLSGLLPAKTSLHEDCVEVRLGCTGRMLPHPRAGLGPLTPLAPHTQIWGGRTVYRTVHRESTQVTQDCMIPLQYVCQTS